MEVIELNKLNQLLQEYFVSIGLSQLLINYALAAIWSLISLFVAWLSYRISTKYVVKLIEKLIFKTKSNYDDLLIERNVFKRLVNIIPALVLYAMLPYIFDAFAESQFLIYLRKIISSTIVFIILWSFSALLAVVNDIYNTFPYAKDQPIRGLIQILQIAASFISVIVIVSILFDINVSKIMTGLGATAAVLLLVFKDTILGFVASIQLSANKMVSAGDWITMPTYKTDGTVMDISLTRLRCKTGIKPSQQFQPIRWLKILLSIGKEWRTLMDDALSAPLTLI
jgi:miniconductance mechanosensitive channel